MRVMAAEEDATLNYTEEQRTKNKANAGENTMRRRPDSERLKTTDTPGGGDNKAQLKSIKTVRLDEEEEEEKSRKPCRSSQSNLTNTTQTITTSQMP